MRSLSPATLREHSRQLRHAAANEANLETRQKHAGAAVVLAQFAALLEQNDALRWIIDELLKQ